MRIENDLPSNGLAWILMSKMGSHDPFEHLKDKLWQKKRLGVKLPI
jgi:hypothetical protein